MSVRFSLVATYRWVFLTRVAVVRGPSAFPNITPHFPKFFALSISTVLYYSLENGDYGFRHPVSLDIVFVPHDSNIAPTLTTLQFDPRTGVLFQYRLQNVNFLEDTTVNSANCKMAEARGELCNCVHWRFLIFIFVRNCSTTFANDPCEGNPYLICFNYDWDDLLSFGILLKLVCFFVLYLEWNSNVSRGNRSASFVRFFFFFF